MQDNLKEIIQELEYLFDDLNKNFYNGELEKIVITVSPDSGRRKTLGWCTSWKAWKNEYQSYYEINMTADKMNRPFEEIAETMLHEQAHLYNLQHDIKDTSRSGTYHNKKYKQTAESHGLICEKTSTYGYSVTTLNEEAKTYISNMKSYSFKLFRTNGPDIEDDEPDEDGTTEKPKKGNSIKYVCPGCNNIIRATKEVNVFCGDCMKRYEESE